MDARLPVANRYFGVFQDGSAKLRGIEARRRDTTPFIAQTQVELLGLLAGARRGEPDSLPWPQILALLRGTAGGPAQWPPAAGEPAGGPEAQP